MTQTLSQVRAAAGRLGGLATVRRHGREHMRRIGKRGGDTMHKIYKLEPVALNDFALIHRETGQPVALLSGKPLGWTPWGDA